MDLQHEVLEAQRKLADYWDANEHTTQNWSEVAASVDSNCEGGLVLRVFIEPGSIEYEQFRKGQVMKDAGIAGLVSDVHFVESEQPVLY